MNSYERRVCKLEAKRVGPPEPINIVRLIIDPKRGAISALFRVDESWLERAMDESEDAFKDRVEARSAIVFGGAQYGGSEHKGAL